MNRYAVISVDMHRGHLDPEVATMPLPAERCRIVIDNTARLFERLREFGVPIIHVVAGFRNPQEALSNPHWRANDEDPRSLRKTARAAQHAGVRGDTRLSRRFTAKGITLSTTRSAITAST